MNKIICFFVLVFLPITASASEWYKLPGIEEIDFNEVETEQALWTYLSKFNEYDFPEKETYKYQYQSISKGLLHINALCSIHDSNELKKYFILVMDGGACYFQIKYNIETGKFLELSVNGVA